MSAPRNTRVDTLLHSLKEFQAEKQILEQKLRERNAARKALEAELESVNGKCLQMVELHKKMTDTLNIAQFKMTQKQTEAESQDRENQISRKEIEHIAKNVEDEILNQTNQIQSFEEELSKLADDFLNYRKYYSQDNMNQQIDSLTMKISDLEIEAKGIFAEVESLSKQLQAVGSEKDKDPFQQAVPLEMRKLIWDMVKTENNAAHNYLQKLRAELTEIHLFLQSLL